VKLLFLLPSEPEPADSGAKLRNLALLTLAGRRHEADALAFGAGGLPEPPRPTAMRRLLQLLDSGKVDIVARYASAAFREKLAAMLAQTRYDAVQAEGIEMAQYLDLVPPERRIYDAHNAEFLLQRRAAETANTPVANLYSRLQWRRLERFERAVVRNSQLTLSVSEHDANQLLALTDGSARIRVVPNAIDVRTYPYRPPYADAAPNLLFLGKLDYRPNTDAVRWLVQRLLPLIHAHASKVRLFVVGANPPAWLVAAGQHDPRIAVTGYVADERPYLERCSALLLPVKTAGGSRLKALVAMASGLPIVSTRLGMEGLDAAPDEHFLCAESDREWVGGVCRVVESVEIGRRFAERARKLVEERYDWSAIEPAVEAAYAELGQ
jgi:polysaccharide biosynthesis protein PslH